MSDCLNSCRACPALKTSVQPKASAVFKLTYAKFGLSKQYPYIYFCRMIKKTLFNVLTLKTYEDSANPGRTVLDSKQFIYTLQPILPVWSSSCTSTVMYSMFYSYTVHPRHFLIFVWSRDTYCYTNTVIDKLFKFIILKFSSFIITTFFVYEQK